MPARPFRLAALAVLAAAACTPVERPAAPLDRFTFPTGITLANDHLLVVSSNFDLTYEDDKGGSVLSVDPGASLAGSTAVTSALRIASFGGEIAVANGTTCGLGGDQAVIANRLTGELIRLGLGADGRLSCGADCHIPISDPGEGDPFSVEVVCRAGAAPRAYVGWLRARTGKKCSTASSTTTCGVISEVPLAAGAAAPSTGTLLLNSGGIRKLRYDAQSGLLFFLSTGARVGWVDLSAGCEIASSGSTSSCPSQSVDLSASVAGLEVRSIGISTPGLSPRRLYVAAQLYDPSAASSGVRVDVGGALLVLSIEPSALGGYDTRVLRVVSLGTGASELQVIPRAGQRDLLALSLTADGEVWFWDDEIGAVTGVIGRETDGRPKVGNQPWGLAYDESGPAGKPIRLYVGSFGDARVTAWNVDPTNPDPLATPPGVASAGRIGD